MTARKVVPGFASLTDGELADQYAIAKVKASDAEKRLKAIAAELVSRGRNQYLGALYTIVKVAGEQSRFNSEAAIAELGQAWYDGKKRPVATVGWAVSVSDKASAALDAIAPAPPAAALAPADPKLKTRRRKAA